MLRDKILSGGQRAAELYCASQPQWEYIVPAMLLGVAVGATVTVGVGWWVLRRLGTASRRTLT